MEQLMDAPRSLRLAIVAVLAALAAPVAHAGDADLQAIEGDKENGPPFFGEATNVKGMRPLEGVRIRAQVKGQPLPVFVNTNDEGRFSLRGFGKSVDPESVDIQCAMDGYHLLDLTRRRVSKAADAATVVECLFEKR
jgi:hypothetical protein